MKKVLLLLLIASPSWANISTHTVWQVQTGGSDTNGGGFIGDPAGASGVDTAVAKIAAPSTPIMSCVSSGGSIAGSTTYYAVITFTDVWGETVASAQGSLVVNNANCGGNTNTNTITFTAPTSAPGCQSGVTCTWSGYIQSISGGPWAQSFTAQALSSNKAITSIPSLPGTQAHGTDYTQQDAAQIAVTDAVAAGTTTITSATAAFNGSHVGNTCYVEGGTGSVSAQWYQIISVTDSTTITVDRSSGLTAGTGVTLNCGGALATPGLASARGFEPVAPFIAMGNKVFIKNDGGGIYWISSGSDNISGGLVALFGGDNGLNLSMMIGYTSNRTLYNTDSRPTLKVCQDATPPCSGAVNSITVVRGRSGQAGAQWFSNLIIDANGATASVGLSMDQPTNTAFNIKVLNSTSKGINIAGGNTGNWCVQCEVTGASGTSAIDIVQQANWCIICYSHDNTTHGFRAISPGQGGCIFCISDSNTGVGTNGFELSLAGGETIINSVAYANGKCGFNLPTATYGNLIINNIAEANVSLGFCELGSPPAQISSFYFFNNAAYNNNSTTALSGQYSQNGILNPGTFINNTTGTFFTNAAAGDFSLNSTAGQGALAKEAGIPGVYPAGLSTSYIDIGAVIGAASIISGQKSLSFVQ